MEQYNVMGIIRAASKQFMGKMARLMPKLLGAGQAFVYSCQ